METEPSDADLPLRAPEDVDLREPPKIPTKKMGKLQVFRIQRESKPAQVPVIKIVCHLDLG